MNRKDNEEKKRIRYRSDGTHLAVFFLTLVAEGVGAGIGVIELVAGADGAVPGAAVAVTYTVTVGSGVGISESRGS